MIYDEIVSKFWFTYVLRSRADNKLYFGFTENLKVRIRLHNTGNVPATKNRLPLELIYFEACLNKDQAIKREKYFKTGFGRNFLNNRIQS